LNGVAGGLEGPSSYLMKSPPKQVPDDDAYEATESFIRENARATSLEHTATQ
jgi:myo-inositol-1-phosphate synthase